MDTAIFSSKLFDYDRDHHTFTAEVSMLSHSNHGRAFGRIFVDSADEGLVMISADSGKEAKFFVEEIVRDREQDVISWKLLPTTETCREIPRLNGSQVVVFNT